MSQHSEERVSDEVSVSTVKAQVLPFERPQSELQKAVQQRAQERIELERERARRQRPAIWRRVLVLALAAIPMFITFGAAIAFVGALRQYNSAIFNSAGSSGTQQASPQPTVPTTNQRAQPPQVSSDPDVVLLQPYSIPAEAGGSSGKSTVTPERR